MDHLDLMVETHGPGQTQELAETIGRSMGPGSILLLSGDLGSGKTAFIQGLARGLDVPPGHYVTSPTYTLIHEYPARHPFFHVDLYRLQGPADLEDIGLTELFAPQHVVAIEWADRLSKEDLPKEYLAIHFTFMGDTTRRIRLIAYGLEWINLIESIGFSSGRFDPIG
jgi:tRNA threonylcarbamoyladenosine biosynthesis protein TsaE